MSITHGVNKAANRATDISAYVNVTISCGKSTVLFRIRAHISPSVLHRLMRKPIWFVINVNHILIRFNTMSAARHNLAFRSFRSLLVECRRKIAGTVHLSVFEVWSTKINFNISSSASSASSAFTELHSHPDSRAPTRDIPFQCCLSNSDDPVARCLFTLRSGAIYGRSWFNGRQLTWKLLNITNTIHNQSHPVHISFHLVAPVSPQ